MSEIPLTSVITIDARYVKPEFAAAYLVVSGEGASRVGAVVETNTAHAVPYILEAIQKSRLTPAQIKYVVVTHVHLDHAGGAGALLAHLPNAKLLVHPRGRRHLVDPARLEAAVRAVYGESRFDELYGKLVPIPDRQIESIEDGETRSLGEETLQFFHVRGHANHHFAVRLKSSGEVFTGDSFGLCYPEVSTGLRAVGMPLESEWGLVSTSPSDFDAKLARISLELILSEKPRSVYLTHFGELKKPERVLSFLQEQLEFAENWVEELRLKSRQQSDDAWMRELTLRWRNLIEAQWKRLGVRPSAANLAPMWEILAMDVALNAQGLLAASTRMA